MCCCCICYCSSKETKDLSCCGYFPIKCAVIFIGILIFTLTICITIELFMCFLSEYIQWWYVTIALVLIIPLFIATAFVINFWIKDDEKSRGKM